MLNAKPTTKLFRHLFFCRYADEDIHDKVDGVPILDTVHAVIATIKFVDPKMCVSSHRMRRILELRFGLDGGGSHTLKEVSKEFGVTGERIRQIEGKGLRKLRHPSRARWLQLYIKGREE